MLSNWGDYIAVFRSAYFFMHLTQIEVRTRRDAGLVTIRAISYYCVMVENAHIKKRGRSDPRIAAVNPENAEGTQKRPVEHATYSANSAKGRAQEALRSESELAAD
jgi:hypothetical protein